MLTIRLFALSLTIRPEGRFRPLKKVPCQASFAVCLTVHRAPVDWSAHFASTTSSIPISGTLPSNDSECLAREAMSFSIPVYAGGVVFFGERSLLLAVANQSPARSDLTVLDRRFPYVPLAIGMAW
jgi:hypothetical protein